MIFIHVERGINMIFRFRILPVFILSILAACAGPRGNMTPQQEADMLYSRASQLHEAEFYDEASGPDTCLQIATGEQRIYANLLLTIGVVPPE